MKSIFKFFALKIIVVAFCTFGTSSIFAQDLVKECKVIYEKFLYSCDKNCDKSKIEKGLATAKLYLEKCGKIKGNEKIADYLIKQIPKLESTLEQRRDEELLYKPFNASVPAKDWEKTFSLGKQILAKKPEFLDVILVLASIGFDNTAAYPPFDKYNDDAITYAKIALQQMNQGKTSENYGSFQYVYKTKECPDGKLNATGWMNYIVGYITFYRLKNQKDAIPYFEQSTQTGCETKTFHKTYQVIGAWYLDEAFKLQNSRSAKIKAAGNQETDETKSILVLQKDYIEQAKNAYTTAYKLVSTNPKISRTDKNSLYRKIEEVSKIKY